MQHPCMWLVQHMGCHMQHPATAGCPCICHCRSQSCIAAQSITAAADYKHMCAMLPRRTLKLAISKRSTQSVVKARRPLLQAIALENPALLHSHTAWLTMCSQVQSMSILFVDKCCLCNLDPELLLKSDCTYSLQHAAVSAVPPRLKCCGIIDIGALRLNSDGLLQPT